MVTAARHADDWNASDYAANSRGQEAWGRALIAQLRVQPSDTILDIGCGDGRLTALLATAAPDGRVVGIDLSPDMIRLARERFGNQPNLMFETGDAATLPFDGGFTKVFSNATLHWVPDHAAVLDGIGRALEPGGRCLLQMAGAGNALEVMRALEACGDDVRWPELLAEPSPWAFLDDFTYRRLIDASGLRALDVRLFPRDMHHESRDAFRGWLRTTWHPYLKRVDETLRDALLDSIIERYLERWPAGPDGSITLVMVRLQVEAEKPTGRSCQP